MSAENAEESLQPIAFRVRSSAGSTYGRTQNAILMVDREGLTLERTKRSTQINPELRAQLFDRGRFRTIYQFARRTPGWSAFMIVSEGMGFRVIGLKSHQIESLVDALRRRGFVVETETVPTRLWWSTGYFTDYLRREGKLSADMMEI